VPPASNRMSKACRAAPPVAFETSVNAHVTLFGSVAEALPSGFTANVPVNCECAAELDPAVKTSSTPPNICPEVPVLPWAMKLPAAAKNPLEPLPL